jgi:hypothetical protein
MPRWASRIQLQITGLRIERLNDISADDAIAEGCLPFLGVHGDDDFAVYRTSKHFNSINDAHDSVPMPICRYAVLWESINGAGSWAANPWVVVYSFEVIKL